MNLKWLETFRRVVELRSYTRAADTLDLSQPAVSQQVHNLERIFGGKLIRQVGRGIEVTEAGEKVYAVAVRIENDIRRLRYDLAELSGHVEGLVRIACGPTALCHYIPRLLKRFWSEYPDISVQTYTLVGQPITDAVLTGRADIGIQSPAHLDPSLVAVPCMEDHIILVCSPDHPLADAEYVSARELRDIKVGLIFRPSETRRLIDEWLTAEGVVLEHPVEFGATEAVRAAALAGVVAGFASEYSVREDLTAGRLRRVRISGPQSIRRMYALHRRDADPPIARMIEVVTWGYSHEDFWAT
jgi:DNA-binding transcriptional LysR family regulator